VGRYRVDLVSPLTVASPINLAKQRMLLNAP
jgi:hypothetical protein